MAVADKVIDGRSCLRSGAAIDEDFQSILLELPEYLRLHCVGIGKTFAGFDLVQYSLLSRQHVIRAASLTADQASRGMTMTPSASAAT